MHVLMRLSFLQAKGKIRNVFSKPSSAIITILIVLIYGALIVSSLFNPTIALSILHMESVNMAILINIGYSALMITTLMLQKKIALFFENDAFYLFTGPFKRSSIMQFLMFGIVSSALLFGAINVLIMVLMGMGLAFDFFFLFLVFISQSLMYFFFLVVLYYLYLVGMENSRMRLVTKLIPVAYGVLIAALFAITFAQHNFDLSISADAFINGSIFYFIPVLGWVKLILVSYVMKDFLLLGLGFCLLLGVCVIVFMIMSSYKVNFVEQAMMDAQEFSLHYKEIKQGRKSSMNDRKVRDVKIDFGKGAKAIFSKNMLIMRKSRSFITFQDIMLAAIYIVVALVMDLGFTVLTMMLVICLFMMIQNSDFLRDMKNYQLYLIPDHPFKKLIYTMLPTLLKTLFVMSVCMVVATLVFQPRWMAALQNYIMLCGYTVLFMSASVVSLRLLKSRSNPMLEQVIGMLVMILAAIPGTGLLIYFAVQGELTVELMNWITIGNLAINFVIALLILYSCKNMMNGRDIMCD